MSGKKGSKKQEQRLQQLQKQQQQQKKEAERMKKQERLKQLAIKSAPLHEYGLLDAYEFFLSQLASAGIPQGKIYEFAAQSVLKFQKNKNKKVETLRQVSRVNEQAVKIVSQRRSKSQTKIHKQIKPQILPFKGDLTPQQKSLMGIK